MSRRIQQLQSFTAITDTDSGSLVSRTRIHHLILCHKTKNPLLQSDRNTDLTFQVRRSTVLQGILHKGDQQHRRNLSLRTRPVIRIYIVHVRTRLIHPVLLQFDVTADVLSLLLTLTLSSVARVYMYFTRWINCMKAVSAFSDCVSISP